MRLEDITAVVRPRGHWEAVDLGFALTRRYFGKLLLAWLLCVGPIWALLLWASQWIGMGWVILLIWWWKPLYDRVPLFILSRALFGAVPKLSETLRAWPRLLFSNLWHSLVATRISGTRSLLLPVSLLEGLRGKDRKDRAAVLIRHSGGCASSLTFVCAFYEGILAIAIGMLLYMFVPEDGSVNWLEMMAETGFTRGLPPGLIWLVVGCWLGAMTLVELYYVGGGFGLYLNARTHLEGWDIELAFRRLGNRLAGVAAALVLFFGVSSAMGQDVELSEDQSAAREEIAEILAHEEFKVHKTTTWVTKSKGNLDLGGFGSFFQLLGYVVLAIAVAALVLILTRFIMRYRHTLRGGFAGARKPEPKMARSVAGLDVTPESLPDDIPNAARQLWLTGDAAGALSLLYRGSLSWLVNTLALPIRDSDTEGDCLNRATQIPESNAREYFTSLTTHWVTAAYAGHAPAAPEMEALLANWPYRAAHRGGSGK